MPADRPPAPMNRTDPAPGAARPPGLLLPLVLVVAAFALALGRGGEAQVPPPAPPVAGG